MFSQVLPPSLLRSSQPSSTAQKIREGSSARRAISFTCETCGGFGKVHSFVVGSFFRWSQSTQVSPPSALLNTEDGSVPTYSSPVVGCWVMQKIGLYRIVPVMSCQVAPLS